MRESLNFFRMKRRLLEFKKSFRIYNIRSLHINENTIYVCAPRYIERVVKGSRRFNDGLPYEHVYARGFQCPGDRFPACDNRKFLPSCERKSRICGGRRRWRRAIVSGLIARFRGGQFAQFATHVEATSLERDFRCRERH